MHIQIRSGVRAMIEYAKGDIFKVGPLEKRDLMIVFGRMDVWEAMHITCESFLDKCRCDDFYKSAIPSHN